MKKTHWKKLFNYEYLGAWSLDQGEEKQVTIKKTDRALVKSAQSPKGEDLPIVYFEEFELPMVLNPTNCKSIANIYGNMVEDWIGKKAILYVQGGIKAFGSITEALRIRPESHLIDSLSGMLSNVSDKLSDDELTYANRIIDNKEKDSYSKLHKFLKSKA